jgi:hypothetical protein
MTSFTDIERDVAELRRELAIVKAREQGLRFQAVGAMRRGRLNLAEEEHRAAWRRLAPDVSLIRWRPRGGEESDPNLATSLVERLRSGSPVADSLGNTDAFLGLTNLLPDGPLDTARNAAFFPISPSAAVQATQDFWGQATLTSGTNPSNFWNFILRTNSTLFNSAGLRFVIEGLTTALDLEQRLWAPGVSGYSITSAQLLGAAFIAAACGVYIEPLTRTNVTTLEVTLELVKNIAGSPVVLASQTVDLLALPDHTRQELGVSSPVSNVVAGDRVALRVKLHTVTSGTGAAIYMVLYEPRLHFSLTADAMPFSPVLAGWEPAVLDARSSWQNSDVIVDSGQISASQPSAQMLMDGTLKWGPGGASVLDTRLRRSGTKTLTVDDTAGGAASLNVVGTLSEDGNAVYHAGNAPPAQTQVSRDAAAASDYLARIKAAADTQYRLELGFASDSKPQILLGAGGSSSPDWRLRRTATGEVTIDANGAAPAGGPRVIIEGNAAGDEGGELSLMGAAANADWNFDNYQGRVRWHSAGTQYYSYGSGDLRLMGPSLMLSAANDFGNTDVRLQRTGADAAEFDNGGGGDVALNVVGKLKLDGVGLETGTVFPVSPTADDLFYRTDRNVLYFYDGTRWLSVTAYEAVGAYNLGAVLPIAATTGSASVWPLVGLSSDIYLLEHQVSFFVAGGTALSASHKWVATWRKTDTANADTTVVTATIDSGALSTWRTLVTAINALLGTYATYPWARTTWTKTGTPGNLHFGEKFTYRLVG